MQLRKKLTVAATCLSLGGLTGVAMSAGGARKRDQAPVPMADIRTVTTQQTIHRYKYLGPFGAEVLVTVNCLLRGHRANVRHRHWGLVSLPCSAGAHRHACQPAQRQAGCGHGQLFAQLHEVIVVPCVVCPAPRGALKLRLLARAKITLPRDSWTDGRAPRRIIKDERASAFARYRA